MTGYRPRGGGREPVGEVDVFARPGQQATAQVQVFTRRASGLVRVMSPYSAFAYNILNIGIIFPWVYITTIILFPGASIWLGIFITGVFTGFLAVVYAGLASAMPRTRGDYVFQSRTVRPWLSLAIVSMVVMSFITPAATFISRYDRAATSLAGSGPGSYQGVLSTAIANGFTPNRAFDLLGTLLITPVPLTSLGWVGYAQEQAGEIQGAQSLRNQMFINLGGGLVSTLMMAVLAIAMVGTVDQQWLAAAAGSGAPIAPWFSNLAMVLTDNPIILFLMIIGILLNALQVVFNVIVGWTRVAVAMSIDGALPRAVSHVSPRTHTPVNAHVIFLILGGFL